MARFLPSDRDIIRYGSSIADYIVCKNTRSDVRNSYDITTMADPGKTEECPDIFARLMRMETESRVLHYRVCLQDDEIIDFLTKNPDIDMLTFMVYVMTHEIFHIHRFVSGQADFNQVNYDEEVLVDNITRLLLAKHPVTGMTRVLKLLDKLTPPPLYNLRTIIDQGGVIDAYL